MNNNPGTVSKILWHFTGGPIWDTKTNKQGKKLKQANEAFSNLKAIIKSRTLKIGRFTEVINVVLPTYKEYSPLEKRVVETKNKPITMHSSSVCCLADIPLSIWDTMPHGMVNLPSDSIALQWLNMASIPFFIHSQTQKLSDTYTRD